MQPVVVAQLRKAGVSCYDFRNPPNKSGFGWEQTVEFTRRCQDCGGEGRVDTIAADTTCPSCGGVGSVPKKPQEWTASEYLAAINHPIAEAGFRADIEALRAAYICVLVQPSGRSAALEFGYAAAMGKRCAVLLAPAQEPELMLKVGEFFTDSLPHLVAWAAGLKGL